MEQEISGFDKWLQSAEVTTRGLQLVPTLNSVAGLAGKTFGARLHFAEILGRRWSYIAGEIGEQPLEHEVYRIPLEGRIGLVSDGWGAISESDRGKLVAFLNRLITSRQER